MRSADDNSQPGRYCARRCGVAPARADAWRRAGEWYGTERESTGTEWDADLTDRLGRSARGSTMANRRNGRMPWQRAATDERRVHTSIFLPRLTVADGEWLAQVLPALQRNARPEPQSVRVEDISLRYRSGRLGIADALDATSTLLEPFARAGAALEHRNEWYIADEDDEDEELFDTD